MSISSLDLNLLVVLDTVLAERSVARAARRLHVTPSAISNALARLRGELDDPLVIRSGRGVVPTPRAPELAPTLARLLRELDEAVHGARFDPKTTDRELTLAVADAGQVVWLPRLAGKLASVMPRARLRVIGIDMLLAAGGLADAGIDAAVAMKQKTPPGVRSLPLYDERMVLVARRDHPRIRSRIAKAELAALRHVDIHIALGRGSRDVARSYARAGVPREIALAVPTFTAAAAVVSETDLVATLPVRIVERLGERLGIREVGSPTPPVVIAMELSWHQRTEDDPAARIFRGLIVGLQAKARRARPR